MLGLTAYAFIGQRTVTMAVISKAAGGDQPCPFTAMLRLPWTEQDLNNRQEEILKGLVVEREDSAFGIELLRTGGRAFWIKKAGSHLPGKELLAFVLAEQDWIASHTPQDTVQAGDVVVDVGAHVGTFDDDALRRGASRVILVEPDPVNVECIRRNFEKEIADGRVLVVPEGAWSSESVLEFSVGLNNSGSGSFVYEESGAKKIRVPVRPLDDMLAKLEIRKVNFIKMDIEGAEREALKGARETLKHSKPVLMLDWYHLVDDPVVLPRLIQDLNPSYRLATCNLCSPDSADGRVRIVPHVVFYR